MFLNFISKGKSIKTKIQLCFRVLWIHKYGICTLKSKVSKKEDHLMQRWYKLKYIYGGGAANLRMKQLCAVLNISLTHQKSSLSVNTWAHAQQHT